MEWGRDVVVKRKSYTSRFGDFGASEKTTTDLSARHPRGKPRPPDENNFKNSTILLCALLPPVLVVFFFSGRSCLLCFCFGALLCYILDLMGLTEGTIFLLAITLIGIFVSAAWAARFLIQESYVNLTLLITMGIVIVFLFLVLVGSFRCIHIEFQAFAAKAEQLIFLTLPLVGSSIITWFLCVEISSLDLPTCFSSVYFLYLLLLGHPTIASFYVTQSIKCKEGFMTQQSPSYKEEDRSKLCRFVLDQNSVLDMYIVPVLFGPILHLVVHHNVLSISVNSLLCLVEAFLFPLLLVSIALERQLGHWSLEDREGVAAGAAASKYASALLLFSCIQRHPLFDEIKNFAGMLEPTPSLLLCATGLLFYCAVSIQRIQVLQPGFRRVAVTVCVAGSAFLGGYLLDLSIIGLCVIVIGAVSLGEVYRRHGGYASDYFELKEGTLGAEGGMTLIEEGLVVLACLSAIYITHVFHQKTLAALNFTLALQSGYVMHLDSFCSLESIVSCIAVAGPALLLGKEADSAINTPLGYVSGVGKGVSGSWIKDWMFFVCLQIVSVVLAMVELLIQEQDWADYGVSASQVYPPYLLFVTAGAMIATAYHLSSIRLISPTSCMFVLVVQACKLLHLLGLPSESIVAVVSIILAYSVPFVMYLTKYRFLPTSAISLVDSSSDVDREEENFWGRVTTALFYICLGCVVTLHFGLHLASIVLSDLLSKSATKLEVGSVATALWLAFSSAVLNLYAEQLVLLRSILLCAAGFLVLVSTESLGMLRLSIDETSSTYLMLSLHPEMAQGDHSGAYAIVTTILIAAAAVGIFNVNRPVPRLLFVLSLSYCSAQILLSVAFPASMGIDSPLLGGTQLPWLYTFVFTLCSCSIALRVVQRAHSRAKMGTDYVVESHFKNPFFLAWTILPFVAIVWTMLESTFRRHALGIMWVAAIQFGLCSATVRIRSLLIEFGAFARSSPAPVDLRTDESTISFSSWSVLISFVWGSLACIYSPHVSSDIGIPLISLLFVFSRDGFFIPNISALKLSSLVSACWWLISAICAILLKGYSHFERFDAFHLGHNAGVSQVALLGDYDVSIWRLDSPLVPLMNLLLTFSSLPSIYFSITSTRYTL